jgi:pimeloyl-ACP methyl ester carboxylesterase
MTPHFFTHATRTLAYHLQDGTDPTIVFLGGLRSDMTGTKAMHVQDWALTQGRAFLRFDYSGHGESSGQFTDGCIGDWADDAAAIITHLTQGPLVLVGSSMGGWISLLLARQMPDRIKGLITIAGAPDFTEDSMWNTWTDTQRHILMTQGQLSLPSDYGDDLIIPRRMIEDGRDNLVLRDPLQINAPVRLLQGTADDAVPPSVAWRLLDHIQSPDIRLELIKGADHRFSDPACLATLTRSLDEVLA